MQISFFPRELAFPRLVGENHSETTCVDIGKDEFIWIYFTSPDHLHDFGERLIALAESIDAPTGTARIVS